MGRLEEIKRRWGEACLQPNDSVIGKLPDDLAWLVARVEELEVLVERQRLAIVNLTGSREISGGDDGDGCDVMVGCKECGRIGRYRSFSADEVDDLRACLKDRDASIEKLEAKVARQISKGAGYIQDGVKDADDASADTFEEAAKMLAWLAEHGTMPRAVEQAIKDFRAKAKELRGE